MLNHYNCFIFFRNTKNPAKDIIITPAIAVTGDASPVFAEPELLRVPTELLAVPPALVEVSGSIGLSIPGSMPSSSVVGFCVMGFSVVGFCITGLSVEGFSVTGFSVEGFSVDGFSVEGFSVIPEEASYRTCLLYTTQSPREPA